MPITGRTPKECLDQFRKHIGPLVAATLAKDHPLLYENAGSFWTLTFRQAGPITIPLKTKLGMLFFALGQSLEAVKEEKQYRLRTRQYWYRLQEKPELNEKAVLRWEYDSTLRPGERRYCRHHVQAATRLPIAGKHLDLDRAHTPTGWVTIEEVIRFLITELGVRPPCGDSWPEKLAVSEEVLFEEFTSKRYKK